MVKSEVVVFSVNSLLCWWCIITGTPLLSEAMSRYICDSTWEKGPYRAYNDFSV